LLGGYLKLYWRNS